ncbi:DUF3299 domain-containing protein [Marinibactrum halimedae]|nr:DUF3299 domain-containing protein [Marinibactrum halimedae]
MPFYITSALQINASKDRNRKNHQRLLFMLLTLLSFYSTTVLSAETKASNLTPEELAAEAPQAQAEQPFEEIEWEVLIPEDDLKALLAPPEYLGGIEDGSSEDSLESNLQISPNLNDSLMDDQLTDYEKALVSTNVRPEFHNRRVKIPGFIVPLEFDKNKLVTQFFLVPYFGACLHQPPPPPNQIIYVKYEKGITLKSLYEPFWLLGTLKTQVVENDTATSAYAMNIHDVLPYEDY